MRSTNEKFSLSLSVLFMSGILTSASAKQPNIVLIYTDDQPLRAMGNKDPYFSTPYIDQLAQKGVVFENNFVCTSVSCVSRASILTGQHSLRHGINSFNTPLTTAQMQQTYSGILRRAGYRTAFLGKFGIGHTRFAPKELCLPADQFDLWYGFLQSPSYFQMVNGEKRYLTTVIEEKSIEFLKNTPKDQPFLLTLALPEPHGQSGPWNYRDPDFKLDPPSSPPAKPKTMNQSSLDKLPQAILDSRNHSSLELYEAGYSKYMATVRHYTARTDLAIGRIMQALEELGMAENTVIIYTSDNGSMWGAHGLSGKWNMYEESIRVPLIIYDPRLPSKLQGNRKQMALNIDIAPTVLSIAGQTIPKTIQGTDLTPLLKNAKLKGRSDWYYYHAVETESSGKPLPTCEGVRGNDWKYIRYIGTRPLQEELFYLKSDPNEEQNLAYNKRHKKMLEKMRNRCDELRESVK
jgi:arylsulfatase A-like enzyme